MGERRSLVCPECGSAYIKGVKFCAHCGTLLSGLDVDDGSGSEPLPAGTLVGSYRLIDLLGEGGMGRVYVAEHIKLGRRVAVKMLRQELVSNPTAVARFFAEAKAVNRISHENIVEITDFVEQPGGDNCIIMELLKGEDLGQRLLRKLTLPLDRAFDIAAQVASALGAVHNAGIIHRDLKPDNVFLIERGGSPDFVKLLDFGVAKLSDPSGSGGIAMHTTAAGQIIGTPEYMSPEQAGGQAVDHRTDIYSLGVIVYEMITGVLPFQAKSFGELLIKHMTEPLPEIPNEEGLPPAVRSGRDQLIEDLLAKDPNLRPHSMQDVEKRLRDIIDLADARPPSKKRATSSGSNPRIPDQPELGVGSERSRSRAEGTEQVAKIPIVRRPTPLPRKAAEREDVERVEMQPLEAVPISKPVAPNADSGRYAKSSVAPEAIRQDRVAKSSTEAPKLAKSSAEAAPLARPKTVSDALKRLGSEVESPPVKARSGDFEMEQGTGRDLSIDPADRSKRRASTPPAGPRSPTLDRPRAAPGSLTSPSAVERPRIATPLGTPAAGVERGRIATPTQSERGKPSTTPPALSSSSERGDRAKSSTAPQNRAPATKETSDEAAPQSSKISTNDRGDVKPVMARTENREKPVVHGTRISHRKRNLAIGGAVLAVVGIVVAVIGARGGSKSEPAQDAPAVIEPAPAPAPPPMPTPAPTNEAPREIKIKFVSAPPGANVRVAGTQEILGVTPFTKAFTRSDLIVGFQFEKPGYLPSTEQVSLSTDDAIAVSLTAKKTQPRPEPGATGSNRNETMTVFPK